MLAALALGTFVVSAAEVAGIGVQRALAAQLGVSVAKVGLVVTVYALACAIGGPILTAAVARLPRRRLLMGVLLAFTVAQVGVALSNELASALVWRGVAGVLQGVFFAVGTVTAVEYAGPERAGRALAVVAMGLTTATVAGAPAASALADAFGWQAAFWALGAVALVAAVACVLVLPAGGGADVSLREQLVVMRTPAMRAALGRTVLALPGLFCAYTYLTPLLGKVTGLNGALIAGFLVVLGVAAAVGSALGGRAYDRAPRAALRWAFLGLASALTLLGVGAGIAPLTLVAVAGIGLSAFAAIPILQGSVIALGGAAPLLGAAANISAFNAANTLGAALGGLAVDVGGLRAPALVAAAITLPSLAWAWSSGRRRSATPPSSPRPCASC